LIFSKFYTALSRHIQLTDDDKLLCEAEFIPFEFAKNSFLEEENKVPKHLYFISEGFMRLFYYDDSSNEITTFLASEGQFITPFLDFIHEKTTNQNLECITDCKVLRIERSRLVTLIDKSLNFKQFSLVIFEQAIASTQSRANDLATQTAEQRYINLLEKNPQFVQNIPLQYISSYLGIKPQSLSRIRKQLIK
jgi:CRP/FNR family transcriptional regulator, anaerobic regulatory protein